MKTVLSNLKARIAVFTGMLLLLQSNLFAQDVKAEIKGEDVGSWFSQNWLWVAGVVVLILVILLFSGGARRSRVTTTTTTPSGRVSRTSTTEVTED
jgi:heme/copper-type cytochrome/quinol oxidase subunit 2